MTWDFVFNCVFICICFYRSKTYIFEEFLSTWQDRIRKLEQPTTMSVKLQAEVDKYKVQTKADLFFAVPKFWIIQLLLNSKTDLNEIIDELYTVESYSTLYLKAESVLIGESLCSDK